MELMEEIMMDPMSLLTAEEDVAIAKIAPQTYLILV